MRSAEFDPESEQESVAPALPEHDPRVHRVVIVGGGFAGVTLARRLEKTLPADWDIYLLSRSNLMTYNPLLPEVVGASVLPGHVVSPLRRILRRTRMRMVNVSRVDLALRSVEYDAPLAGAITYDHLVFACGVTADFSSVPGLAAHGYPLKTLGDALYLRNRVIRMLEEATITPDPARNRWLTSFVVAGGGFSGVEAAGEIADLLEDARPLFKRLDPAGCRVHIVHGGEHLLPQLTPSLGAYTERLMRARGIAIHLSARVQVVDERGVRVNDGQRIDAATVVGTIGTRPHTFVAGLPFVDGRGRVLVDATLGVVGHPGVWAMGDCARVPDEASGGFCPATAQYAVRQAQTLADNLLLALRHEPPKTFRYQARGQLAAVGHRKAVAEILGVRISGLPAWLAWRAFYLVKIPTLARKVRLFFEWTWSMLFRRDVALLDFERSEEAADVKSR